MTEFSAWWTTGAAVGDQQAGGYTQAHWATAQMVMAAVNGYEGVAPSYLNECAGTVTGANTVAINTGGAVVDGKWYNNSASVNVNVPSAVGGGNTRIDRIVLRCSWAGFTIRITRIAGVDAAAPAAPAITQTTGTTYDIMLYQALVDTAGTVTLTDERVFAGPLVYRRQGGSATDWSTPGTSNYVAGPSRMQVGVATDTPVANPDSGSIAITFPVAFSVVPVVYISREDSNAFPIYPHAENVTAAGFTLLWEATSVAAAGAINFNWLAIGLE